MEQNGKGLVLLTPDRGGYDDIMDKMNGSSWKTLAGGGSVIASGITGQYLRPKWIACNVIYSQLFKDSRFKFELWETKVRKTESKWRL